MSTVGTLYDETIKYGFAKLLSVQEVTSPVASLIFVAPLSAGLGYRTFWFDLDCLQPSVNNWFQMHTSIDGGASWAETSNWWSMLYGYSHAATAYYGSVVYGASPQTYLQLTGDNQYSGLASLSGRVVFNRGLVSEGGLKQFQWETAMRHPSAGINYTYCGGTYAGSAAINGIRFRYVSSNIASGAIRCYGLKKGT